MTSYVKNRTQYGKTLFFRKCLSDPVKQLQLLSKFQNSNVMISHDGYDEEDLMVDLENKKKTSEVSFNNILKMEIEKNSWGNALKLKMVEDGKKNDYQFTIVQDWVHYPLKDPTRFLKVNWTPFVDFIKERQTVSE